MGREVRVVYSINTYDCKKCIPQQHDAHFSLTAAVRFLPPPPWVDVVEASHALQGRLRCFRGLTFGVHCT